MKKILLFAVLLCAGCHAVRDAQKRNEVEIPTDQNVLDEQARQQRAAEAKKQADAIQRQAEQDARRADWRRQGLPGGETEVEK